MLAAVLGACVLWPASSAAQAPRRRLEVSGGALVQGGYELGTREATLVRNQPGGGSFTLFRTDSRVETAAGAELRVAYQLTRALAAEAGLTWIRPALRIRTSGDAENAPAVTARDRFSQYTIEGSIVLHLEPLAVGGAIPFVRAGAGHLRQLFDANTLVETGRAYHIGGGLTFWTGRGGRRLRGWGLRGDGRLYVLDGAFEVRARPRMYGAAGAAVIVAF
ncbi:MAG TPA: hypothetical protein VNI83_14680 [Vicinamibacterales bacterium]|nr:hypothetical protein [Vicinamibacterales bacterium]